MGAHLARSSATSHTRAVQLLCCSGEAASSSAKGGEIFVNLAHFVIKMLYIYLRSQSPLSGQPAPSYSAVERLRGVAEQRVGFKLESEIAAHCHHFPRHASQLSCQRRKYRCQRELRLCIVRDQNDVATTQTSFDVCQCSCRHSPHPGGGHGVSVVWAETAWGGS